MIVTITCPFEMLTTSMPWIIKMTTTMMDITGPLDSSQGTKEAWNQNRLQCHRHRHHNFTIISLSLSILDHENIFHHPDLCQDNGDHNDHQQASLQSSTDMGQYPDLLDIPNRDSTVSPRLAKIILS